MVLENGWCPFEHICSHPNFAPGDLFFGRAKRQEVFKKMGIEVDVQPGLYKESDLPKEILDKNKEKSNWEEMSKQYEETEKSIEIPEGVRA